MHPYEECGSVEECILPEDDLRQAAFRARLIPVLRVLREKWTARSEGFCCSGDMWPAGQVGAWLEQGWSGPRTLTGRSHMNTRTSSRHVQQTIKRKASPSTRRPAKSSTVL